RRNTRMECVYAGPEEMARRAGRPPKKAETEQPPKPRVFNPDDFAMTTVYAGPGDSVMEGVYAGPDDEVTLRVDQKPEDVTIEDVYGGPGMMGELDCEEPVCDEPLPTGQPNPSSMMFVYAGPDYFRNRQNQASMVTPVPQDTAEPQAAYPLNYAVDTDELIKHARFCPNCGRMVQPDEKACECGYTLIPDEEPMDDAAADEIPAAADEKPQEDAVKSAPEIMRQDPPMAPVYAGPEYFNRPSV
ncbi:MAG: hypothetical protein IKR59_10260, partial [Lachnospiraceae bacterium]|nr:hypothetical protein [Lachnospiraceae bacterium]